MPDSQPQVNIGVSLDIEPLKQGLQSAEETMRQGVQRMGNLPQAGGSGSAPPPLPPPTVPEVGSASPIASAYQELERIKAMSATSPDVAMAALRGSSGSGGLQSQIMKGAATADPESAQEYQKLIVALKEVSKSVQSNVSESQESRREGGSGIMQMMRQSNMYQAAGAVGQNLAGGNIAGAAGAGIGSLFGPMGMMAGQAIGSGIGNFVGKAQENIDYDMQTADIAARFGDFSQESNLKVGNINPSAGYSTQETAELFDKLRQSKVIDNTGSESQELVKSLQDLTRATGQNTDQLVNQYSTYKQGGGTGSAESLMAKTMEGAIAAGMKSNLSDYSEMLGSARMGLVNKGAMADANDGAMAGIQKLMTGMMGSKSDTSELLKDNPMLAQQMMQGFLSTGSSKAYSYDSAAMQMAGVDRAHTTEGFISPEQVTKNAIARQQSVLNNVMGTGMGTMGFGSMQEMQAAAQQDPNLISKLFTDKNPNTQQSAALQDMLNVQLKGQYGRDPTAIERQQSLQMMQTYASTGTLTPDSKTSEGKSVGDLIAESQKTEGQKARDTAAAQHKEMMDLMKTFVPLLTAIKETTVKLLEGLNLLVGVVKPISEKAMAMLGGNAQAAAPVVGAVTEGAANVLEQATGIKADDKTKAAVTGVGSTVAGVGTSVAQGLWNLSPQKGLGKNTLDAIDMVQGKKPGEGKSWFHDMFNDTPSEGVLATSEYNTFKFAEGDRVFATQGGMGMGGGGMPAINVTINVGNGDPNAVRSAAESGIRQGTDDFMAQWSGRSRGGAKITNNNY